MMNELSLNILDIAQNSISAGASFVEITIMENDKNDELSISVKDDGKGMSEELVKIVENPFVTTRETRKVGLGISFFKQAAEMTGGFLKIDSKLGVGTTITAFFIKSHIDRQPLGDMSETMTTLCTLNPDMDFILDYIVNENSFRFDTKEVREHIGEDVPLSNPSVAEFLKDYIKENIDNLSGGV
jgi:hypothetical protein